MWENGKQNGTGVYTDHLQRTYKGRWLDGKIITFIHSDGREVPIDEFRHGQGNKSTRTNSEPDLRRIAEMDS
jgi:hypothetical protein